MNASAIASADLRPLDASELDLIDGGLKFDIGPLHVNIQFNDAGGYGGTVCWGNSCRLVYGGPTLLD